MDKISLSWGVGCEGEDCYYEMRISESGSPPISKRVEGIAYDHEIAQKCTTYKFELRAWNACGCSSWSDVTPVKIGELPNPPVLSTAVAEKCGVSLNWEPNVSTCPIEKYIVEIQDGQGNYQVIPSCGGDLDKRECILHMYTLT
jgi:hypothetical protein